MSATADTGTGVVITDQRELNVNRNGITRWKVTEFNGGERVMLIAATAGTQFHAHFDAEQWAAFQALVAGGQS